MQQEQLQGQQQQQQQQQDQQQQQVSTPLSQNGQPCGRAQPQMLSPPDMVWPANTLAQVLSSYLSQWAMSVSCTKGAIISPHLCMCAIRT